MLDALGGLDSVVATGGALLANAAWVQVLADVLGRPVEVSAAPEGSARGAALVALERLGLPHPVGADRARRRAPRASGTKSIYARARYSGKAMQIEEAQMIGIVGGGLAAAKLVEGYREAGGTDAITIWSQDPHGPYHRPPLSKRVLRGEAEPADALVHPADWYAEHGVDLRLGEHVGSLDEFDADTIVIATGARPRPARGRAGAADARRLARAPAAGRRGAARPWSSAAASSASR